MDVNGCKTIAEGQGTAAVSTLVLSDNETTAYYQAESLHEKQAPKYHIPHFSVVTNTPWLQSKAVYHIKPGQHCT